MKSRIIIILLFVLTLGLGGIARAQEPAPTGAAPAGGAAPIGNAFTYQGQLKDAGGPVTGACDFQFGLWDALDDGSQVGSTVNQTGVVVNDGLFTVTLDFGAFASYDEARWLEIAVRCPAGSSAYTTLTPRQAITPVPYAMQVGYHNHWGQSWYDAGTGLTLTGDIGLVGNGTSWGVEGMSESTSGVGVYGLAMATSGYAFGIKGQSQSSSGIGVYGLNSAADGGYGTYGEVFSTSGVGALGRADATSGSTIGVYGLAASPDGTAVYGINSATTGTASAVQGLSQSSAGIGVYGLSGASTGNTCGVKGLAQSTDGIGVYGVNGSPTGATYGVYGQSYSTAGYGVYGLASAVSGTTYGVYGRSASTAGFGVYGETTATTGAAAGVLGTTYAPGGNGVAGYNYGNGGSGAGVYGGTTETGFLSAGVKGSAYGTDGTSIGVFGIATNAHNEIGVIGWTLSSVGSGKGIVGQTSSPAGYGVYGAASCLTCNYGLYSEGNFAATGTKASVVETEDYGWLSLYAMESPRVLFEDVNTAQLVNGQAVVTIDPVFAQTVDLTQPYQVFLTPRGDCGLYVSAATAASFSVAALDGKTCSIAFDYRIIAVRKGYTDTRLEPAEDPALASQRNQSDSGTTADQNGGLP